MDITVVTTATDDDEGRALLMALGFPFEGIAGRAGLVNGDRTWRRRR